MPTARPHADADRPRPPLDDFEIALGHRFRDRTLLMRALTHRSYSNERGLGDRSHYERLEFLGDAVLGLATAHWLFTRFPEQAEGMLAKRKSVLVSAKTLASEAKRLALGRYLRLGVGEARSGGHAKASILADAMEAVLGAVYLDGGFAAALPVIEQLIARADAARAEAAGPGDAKTRLQEWLQAAGLGLPSYRLAAAEGPDHDKRFTIDCVIRDGRVFTAVARSKKSAEQRAAADALESLLATRPSAENPPS